MIPFSQTKRSSNLAKSLNIFLMFLFPVSGKDMEREGRQRRVERREDLTHE